MSESESVRLLTLIEKLPSLKSRRPEFRRPEGVKTAEESYDWLINQWMPRQPAFDILAEITILCGFNMVLVVAALIGKDRFLMALKEIAK